MTTRNDLDISFRNLWDEIEDMLAENEVLMDTISEMAKEISKLKEEMDYLAGNKN